MGSGKADATDDDDVPADAGGAASYEEGFVFHEAWMDKVE
jgi:hypothetical protein